MTKRKILYGYQIRGGALEIVPEEQRVVQMLFALYSAGASYQDISDALNRQGVPYSSEIPLWNKHKIKRMLENARYTGKDGYPVMIAETDFQAVQDKISEKNDRRQVSEEVTAAEDVDILDFPSLKEGQVIGEYLQGDEVQRTGICSEAWSQVSFRNEDGETATGYVPTQSLEGIEDETEEASEEAEIGAISPGSGEGIFVDASNKVTAGGTIADGVIVGDAIAVPEDAKLIPLGNFRITHYCQCSLCCGPWANGITSTGVTATTNRTIAVDPSQIPYGSKVVINGQVYVAEDCGGAITENCIDIYVASHEEGEAKGVYYTDVYLLEE